MGKPTQFDTMYEFTGKNILITGGGGHVGRALAKAFLERGASVLLVDCNKDSLVSLQEILQQEAPDRVHGECIDFQNPDAPRAIADRLPWVTLDVVVHSAAFVGTTNLSGWVVPFEEQGLEAWNAALNVNLTAPFAINQALLPALKLAKAPSIVHVSSIYGILGPDMSLYEGISKMGNPAAYAASKGGLDQLTRWMATVLAPDIRVNGINLGGVFRNQDKRFVARYEARVPLGRMATENDVVGPVLFLASAEAAYITGQVLPVDGGYSAW